jgi:copper/silver efflux system protein
LCEAASPPEHKNPLNRLIIWTYRPIIRVVLRAKASTILLAMAIMMVTLWPANRLGSEFMPTLNEGTLFYMPTTLPSISVTKAADLLQMQDRIIKSFPEVDSVFGKAGRAATATDPAPIEMYETVINLKPKGQWRPGVTKGENAQGSTHCRVAASDAPSTQDVPLEPAPTNILVAGAF